MSDNSLQQWRDQIDKDMHQLTSQVSGLTRAVGELTAYQRTQGDRFDRLADSIEHDRQIKATPEWDTPRVAAMVGASVLAVAVAVGSLFYGLAAYVDTQNDPVVAAIDHLEDWKKDKDEFQRETHYETAVSREGHAYHSTEISRLWNHIHKLEEVDREHDKMLAAAETSRRAIGDYLREHTNRAGEH